MLVDESIHLRKTELLSLFERLCVGLELTDAQFALAKDRYEGVGAWLAKADAVVLRPLKIYLQGSTALGTTVKPIGRDEHDVDLVAHVPGLSSATSPGALKKLIGDRLRENGHYAPLLEEKPRCWRLSYANEFHLDITPSIVNPLCAMGGELVPDRKVKEWCPSNPKGYRDLFQKRASLKPRIRLLEAATEKGVRAEVEPFPMARGPKGILRRTVQLLKRHRDQHFLGQDACLPPISVVITTLASRSYEYCVASFVYENEFDLLCDVVRHMVAFIDCSTTAGKTQWFVWNETTQGENFAEKWNSDPRRSEAFFSWHRRALADIETLADTSGIDAVTKALRESFGRGPADNALATLTAQVSAARTQGQLAVTPALGLTVAGASARATTVRPNTFFGKR